MLKYTTLKDHPKNFLAATGLHVAEFLSLLVAFEKAYQSHHPPDQTVERKARQRRSGGGDKSVLERLEDKLLFILVYVKTNPLQSMHGLQFGLSQPQANYWIHRLLPVLQSSLRELEMMPERYGEEVAGRLAASLAPPNLVVDGTERRRLRPTNPARQKAQYSGKKKTHTDKNVVVVNEQSREVVYLGPTEAGAVHDKKAVEQADLTLPPLTTLGQDTGFQGFALPEVLTEQPKKNRKGRTSR